mgnify:CR=1 FL=1
MRRRAEREFSVDVDPAAFAHRVRDDLDVLLADRRQAESLEVLLAGYGVVNRHGKVARVEEDPFPIPAQEVPVVVPLTSGCLARCSQHDQLSRRHVKERASRG